SRRSRHSFKGRFVGPRRPCNPVAQRSTTMQTLPGSERPRQHQRRVSPWWLLTAALWLATPVWAQEPWTWAPTADLNQPRAEHTATLLANGTVLVAGGRDAAGQPLASAEIYDPATGVYTLLASALPAPVWGHPANRLSAGTVLIAGGSNASGALDSAELYDPTAGTVSPAGPLSVPRTLASAALLLDGTALVAGGQTTTSEDLDSAEVYDAATNAFTPLPAPMG